MKLLDIITRFIFLAFLSISSFSTDANARFTNAENNKKEESENPHISEACAAVVLVMGGMAGAGVSSTVLSVLGFSSIGVVKGSLAAIWQSTIGEVSAGSIFSWLQSAAMSGGAKVTIYKAFGGVLAAGQLLDFCYYVDNLDPESSMGKAVITIVATQKTFGHTWSVVEDYVAPSEETTKVFWNRVDSTWDFIENNVLPSEHTQQVVRDGLFTMKESSWKFAEEQMIPGAKRSKVMAEDFIKENVDYVTPSEETKEVFWNGVDSTREFIENNILPNEDTQQVIREGLVTMKESTWKFAEEQIIPGAKRSKVVAEDFLKENVIPSEETRKMWWDGMKSTADFAQTYVQENIVPSDETLSSWWDAVREMKESTLKAIEEKRAHNSLPGREK